MSPTPRLQGAAAAVGATGLAALVLAAPASARQDPGTGALPRNPDQSVATVGPLDTGTVPVGVGTETASTPGDDPGVGYARLVLTGLAGAVVVGVGVATAGSGRRRHPHPG